MKGGGNPPVSQGSGKSRGGQQAKPKGMDPTVKALLQAQNQKSAVVPQKAQNVADYASGQMRQYKAPEVQQVTSGPIDFKPTIVRGMGETPQIQGADLTGLQGVAGQQQSYANQAGQLDPRIQQFLAASTGQAGTTAESIELARQAALGQGPSAAQQQMQRGIDTGIRAQMAAAASGGRNPAALRQAQQQAAMMQLEGAGSAAQLRAQEMQQAQALFGNLSAQERNAQTQALLGAAQGLTSADQVSGQLKQGALEGLAATQGQIAGLQSQEGIAQAQLDLERRVADMDGQIRQAMQNNDLQLAAILNEQKNKLTADLANQSAGLQASEIGLQGQLGFGGLAQGSLGSLLDYQLGQRQLSQQSREAAKDRQQRYIASILSAAGGVGAAAVGGG